jgi:hypothetical protein
MRSVRWILGAVVLASVVAVAVAVAGSRTTAPDPSGPIRNGEGSTQCVPIRGNQALMGHQALRNDGNSPVRIDDVRLLGARGLRLRESYVVPILGTLVGTLPSEPAPGSPAYEAWKGRVSAVGATIAAREFVNLVLVADLTGPPGRHVADNVQVLYHDGKGKSYRHLSNLALVIINNGKSCF